MKNKKVSRLIVYVVSGVLLIACVASYFGGRYMLNLSLFPESLTQSRADMEGVKNEFYENNPYIKEWTDSLKSLNLFTEIYHEMSSGERHHAFLLTNPESQGKTVIAIHGYGSCGYHMFREAKLFYETFGCNILIPDLHAHGYSEGEGIQMGWKDADDVCEWIPIVEETFRKEGYQSKLLIYGVSMGAATTMNISGKDNLPPYIVGFIEDCGYTTVWDEFAWVAKRDYSLPTFPLLNVSNLMCNSKLGWNFHEASPLNSVAKSTLPIMFIHGSEDDYVPTYMVYPLFEAKTKGYKEIWVAEGSAHATSYLDHPQEYSSKVAGFLEKIGF